MGKNIVLVFMGLVIGCGGALAVHSAAAQSFPPNPAAPRWEQTCTAVKYNELDAYVRNAGAEGWELAAAMAPTYNTPIACFKRPAAGAR